uniref:Portal protein n=2 Tax=viral metagenome TaxID=1070528 RepID=A0A6M3IDW1_9ZZZZ
MDRDKIEALKNYYNDTLYNKTRMEQKVDDDYYEDQFDVSDIVLEPVTVMRTGKARRLIDGPADHIITDNPQAFRRNLKDNKTEDEANSKIAELLNTSWLQVFKKQNPNVYKQFVKFLLLRGEAWIQMSHNPDFERGKSEDGLPIILRVPDPIVIFASPNESANGVPEHVILWYELTPFIINHNFPDFQPKLGDRDQSDTVSWMEYWDKDQRYFEADGQVLVNDDNPYGFVPFVHKLSGLGTEDAQGRMERLIVGRLKFSRDTLRRETAIISSLDYSIHTFANRSFTVQGDDMHPVPPDFWEKFVVGVAMGNELPPGVTVTRSVDALPEQQLFQYLQTINRQLELEDPLTLEGVPVGSSARQQDMTTTSALRRYASIIENTEHAFSTAMGMGLKIADTVPKQLPTELKGINFKRNYEVKIFLKAEDPTENDRKVTLGSRLYQAGEIDLETNHIKFQGFTKEQSRDIRKRRIVDNLLASPEAMQIMGQSLLKETGLGQELGAQGMDFSQVPQTPTEQKRLQGEIKTNIGREMIDMSLANKGSRNPPVRV